MTTKRQDSLARYAMSFAWAFFCLALTAAGGSFDHEGCFATWDESTLTVGNDLFRRSYALDGSVLRTVSLALKGKPTFVRPGTDARQDLASKAKIRCSCHQVSPVSATALRCEVSFGEKTLALDVYPGVAGVVRTTSWADSLMPQPPPKAFRASVADGEAVGTNAWSFADGLLFSACHLNVTEYLIFDQTDVRDNLVSTREWLTPTVELPERLTCTALDVRDPFTADGVVLLRLAPMPRSRPSDIPDFVFDGNFEQMKVVTVANGYPLAEIMYAGGEKGRIEALRSLQRSYRPYRPGRDGVFLSNTWGGGNCDSRINADFLMKEVVAGAELGVDVIQIDDGWQKGRTANSMLRKKGQKGAWNGYWAEDPHFWEPDPTRFPNGLEPLVSAAKVRNMRFGLWFGPDSSNESCNWKKDADCLLDFHRRLGIDYFKLDSIKLETAEAFANNRRMIDKMLKVSQGDMVFDLDATSEVRPGFFGALESGPVFVENRYAIKTYRPWSTLRNLWQLAHVVDPVRLRMEVVDPDCHLESCKAEDPLASDKWPKDALFAIAMAASPLGWMELSEIRPDRMAALKPLVARWRRERERLHGGVTYPVGAKPDGRAWTGFLTRSADGRDGYALLFREASENACFHLPTAVLLDGAMDSAEVIGGRGRASVADDGRTLAVEVPTSLDFIWVKVRMK